MAFKNAVDVDLDIAATAELTTHIQSRRVGQPRALVHQGLRLAQLEAALKFGQLHGAVDAGHLRGVGDLVRGHRHTVGHGHLDDVGEVVLALRIFVVQPAQPVAQQARGQGHDAAVNFGDGALGLAGVLVLNNRQHSPPGRSAHNAAVAAGLRQGQREQGQLPAVAKGQQRLQSGGLGQGHVAGQNERDAVILKLGQGLLHRMAGAQLRLLPYALQGQVHRAASQRSLHHLGTVSGNDHRLPGR